MIGHVIARNVREIGYVRGNYYGYSSRSKLPVTIAVEIRGSEDLASYELSIMGDIWRPRRRDIVAGGQINDTLRELLKEKAIVLKIPKYELEKLLDIWDKYHLNAMKPVPEEDMEAYLSFTRRYVKLYGTFPPYKVLKKVFQNYGDKWYFWRIPHGVLRWIIAKWIVNIGEDGYTITNDIMTKITRIEEVMKERGIIHDDT